MRCVDVVLVTASQMPKPDRESPLLSAALTDLGLRVETQAWDSEWDWSCAEIVLCRTPWDYVERLPDFLAWAAAVDADARLVNDLEVLRWNAHKSYLVALERAGVPAVPTTVLQRGASSGEQHAALARHRDVVVKPAVSIGAIGAMHAPSAMAARHLGEILCEGDALVQPFIDSVCDEGEVSLIFFGRTFSHAVRKRPKEGDYRVQDHHGGTVHAHEPTPREVQVATAALEAAPRPTTYARIDLVSATTGPLVMEAELIEPELFLRHHEDAPRRFASEIAACLPN